MGPLRVIEFLCTHLVPASSTCRVIQRRRESIASKDVNFHLNASVGITGIFRIGGVNHTPSQPDDTALAYPNNISGRNRGPGHVIAFTDRSCCKSFSHPSVEGAEGLCQQGASCWLELLLRNLCAVSRLRHWATSRKIAGSIPDCVIGIFHWHNPSGRTMALGSTQPRTEMSTGIFLGVNADGA
jgi:hypothetical protein